MFVGLGQIELGYLIYYQRNVDGLRHKIPNLKRASEDIQVLVATESRKRMQILPGVGPWLDSVEKLVVETEKFLDSDVKANQGCSFRQFPDLLSRYQVSKEAKQKTLKVEQLLNDKPVQISCDAPPARISASFAGESEIFQSRDLTFQRIMSALRDDSVNIVGVHGMGGVGKTTLAKQIAKQAEKDKLFDSIVFAVVSQNQNVKKIQGDIADMLKLKFEANNEIARAGELCERLKQNKGVLIILDDMWEALDLEAVGIPPGNVHKGCKILLTSRNQHVCDEMNVDKQFSIEVLSKEEALTLFKKMAGDVQSEDILPVAAEVANECGGLPIAIVSVATALRNKREKRVWNDALRQLKTPSKSTKGISAKTVSSLKLSYDFLESEEIKYFFLLCCLFPEDFRIPIEHLMKYGAGLRLFENVQEIEEARDRANKLVDDLKSRCLLLGDGDKYITVHDVIRDVGISIASGGEHGFWVRTSLESIKWPEDDTLNNCSAISLIDSHVSEIPDGIDCPKLRVLLLGPFSPYGNQIEIKISSTFFAGMKSLRVLHMNGIIIPTLFSLSLQCLNNLRTLCLTRCQLEDISFVGYLKGLKILSFANSYIAELPKEVGQLTQLKLLDVSDCHLITTIPAGVIANLSQLECLYMRNSFANWEAPGDQGIERHNASLDELKHLSDSLNILEIRVQDMKLYPKDLIFKNLMGYKISIGTDNIGRMEEMSHRKIFELANVHRGTLDDSVSMLVGTTQSLILHQIKNGENILEHLRKEGFSHLKELSISACEGVEYLVSIMTDRIQHSLFPIMENLTLVSVDDLKEICQGHLSSGCPSQLQWNGAATQSGQIVFPKLKQLKLAHLSKFKSFCFEVNSFASDSTVDGAKPLFNAKVIFPSLENLEIDKLLLLKELWANKISTECFPRLKSLKLVGCDKLLKVIPLNLLQMLDNLESLIVGECNSMEAVTDHVEHYTEGIVMPKLRSLELPEMISFFQGNCLSILTSLKKLSVRDCLKMKAFPYFETSKNRRVLKEEKDQKTNVVTSVTPYLNEKVTFPFLKKLTIENQPDLTELWPNKISTDSYYQLSDLILTNCPQLLKVIPLNLLPRLQNFRRLCVQRCDSVKAIIDEEEHHIHEEVMFPKLESLEFLGMLELTSFFRGKCVPKLEDEMDEEADNVAANMRILLNEKVIVPMLTTLTLSGCHKLSKVIPFNLLPRLQNLRSVVVTDCDSLEAIVDQGEHHTKQVILPNLQGLNISSCPKMRRFVDCGASKCRQRPEGEKDGEDTFVADIQIFFNEKVIFPMLQQVEFRNMPRLTGLWPNINICTESYRKLYSLELKECPKLLKVIPLNLLPRLQNLWRLDVSECGSVEAIIDEGGDHHIEEFTFSKLAFLDLHNLLELTCFSREKCVLNFPSLLRMFIEDCPNMTTFVYSGASKNKKGLEDEEEEILDEKGYVTSDMHILFNEKVNFSFLRELKIRRLHCIKRLWHDQVPAESFCQLEELIVGQCDKILGIIPFNYSCVRFQNLRQLYVEHCESVTEILIVEDCKEEKNVFPKMSISPHLEQVVEKEDYCRDQEKILVVFPKLHTLSLIGLPNLKIFFRGSHTLEWPALETLKLQNCPKMQTFSSSQVFTPKLKTIDTGPTELELREGDLNRTTQYLYNNSAAEVCIMN